MVLEELKDALLLEEVCHWAQGLGSQKTCTIFSIVCLLLEYQDVSSQLPLLRHYILQASEITSLIKYCL